MFCVWLGLSTSCAAIYVSTAIVFRVMGQKTAYENPNIICPLLNTLNSLIYDQFRADWLNINRPLLLDTVFSTHMAGPPGKVRYDCIPDKLKSYSTVVLSRVLFLLGLVRQKPITTNPTNPGLDLLVDYISDSLDS